MLGRLPCRILCDECETISNQKPRPLFNNENCLKILLKAITFQLRSMTMALSSASTCNIVVGFQTFKQNAKLIVKTKMPRYKCTIIKQKIYLMNMMPDALFCTKAIPSWARGVYVGGGEWRQMPPLWARGKF